LNALESRNETKRIFTALTKQYSQCSLNENVSFVFLFPALEKKGILRAINIEKSFSNARMISVCNKPLLDEDQGYQMHVQYGFERPSACDAENTEGLRF
jgi:hypothetical protein